MKKEFGPDYASIADVNFKTKYRANCYCNTVQYEVCSDPVDAKICHCLACQKLHGAPMQCRHGCQAYTVDREPQKQIGKIVSE